MDAVDLEMPGTEFDAWRKCLFDFTLRNLRPCTASEWRWLRFRFLTERAGEAEPVQSLAADGETLNVILARESAGTKKTRFLSEDGRISVEITLRPQRQSPPAVSIRMLDAEGRPVEGGRLVFPGVEGDFRADGHGRIRLPYADYLSYLKRVMSLACEPPGGGRISLVMDEE